MAINYNRDIKTFPIIKRTIERITGRESEFHSQTDMGVNRIAFGIIDDEVIQEASRQEIIRRYFETESNYKKGLTDIDPVNRIQMIMEELDLRPDHRVCVKPAREYSERLKQSKEWDQEFTPPVMALELTDGQIITGRGSELMDASASAVLNAIKSLANISDDILLLSPNILEPIQQFKGN